MMIQPSFVTMAVNCVLDSPCDTHLAKLIWVICDVIAGAWGKKF